MHRTACEIDFCYGHRLLNYDGKCRFLHGHNGRAVVYFQAGDSLNPAHGRRVVAAAPDDLRASGGREREVITAPPLVAAEPLSDWIHAELDHRMLLHTDDPALPLLRQLGEPVFMLEENPTAENIAKLIYDQAAYLGLAVSEVLLWETPQSYAGYRQ